MPYSVAFVPISSPSTTAEPFADQASEALDQLWPVIMVVGVMMTLQWFVTFYFGASTASRQVLPIYLAIMAGGAAYYLFQQGDLTKV